MKFHYKILPLRNIQNLVGNLVSSYIGQSQLITRKNDPAEYVVEENGRAIVLYLTGEATVIGRDKLEAEEVRQSLETKLKKLNPLALVRP